MAIDGLERIAELYRTADPSTPRSVPYPDPPLCDGEIELVPVKRSWRKWLFEWGRDNPQLIEQTSGGYERGREPFRLRHWGRFVDRMPRLWEEGVGGAWIVYAPDIGGLICVKRSSTNPSVARLLGCRLTGTERSEEQEARAMRLVAGWARQALGVDYPYLEIECREERAIRCAEAAGLPWHVGEPPYPHPEQTEATMRRKPARLSGF